MATMAKECYKCDVAPLTCDPTLGVCISECSTKITCEFESMHCLLAVIDGNDTATYGGPVTAMSDCFDNSGGLIQEVTSEYCGVIGEELSSAPSFSYASSVDPGRHSCACSGDRCNSALYLEGSNPPGEMTTIVTTTESIKDLTTKSTKKLGKCRFSVYFQVPK